jgi:hypothetical protein
MTTVIICGSYYTLPVEIARTYRGRQLQDNEVYIGRGSPWGNPFVIGKDGTREEVIQKYYQWLPTQPELLAELPSLVGKRLLCWCHPELCHGHIIGLAMLERGIK